MDTDVLCEMGNSIQLSIVVNGGHLSSTPDKGTESEGGGRRELAVRVGGGGWRWEEHEFWICSAEPLWFLGSQ